MAFTVRATFMIHEHPAVRERLATEDDPGYRRVPTALTEVQALAHSADGSLLIVTGPAAAGDERRVRVRDATTRDVRHDLPFASGGGRNVAAGFTKNDDGFWAAGARSAPPAASARSAPPPSDAIARFTREPASRTHAARPTASHTVLERP